MALKLPYPNVYKFFNQFAAPDQASPEQSSRSQGLRKSGPRSKTGCTTCKYVVVFALPVSIINVYFDNAN
jgi:hypothetical protein